MQTQFLAGVIAAWAVAYVGIGVLFALAYRIRRQEPEYLVFAAASVALSIYTAGAAVAYGCPEDCAAFSATIAALGAIAALPLLLHFSVLFARVPHPMRILAPVYAMALALEAVNARGAIFDSKNIEVMQIRFLGFDIRHFSAPLLPMGVFLCVLIGITVTADVLLIANAYRKGRRDALPALLGSAILGASCFNDAGVALRFFSNVWLAPHGFMAFTFGVSSTLLLRYLNLTSEMGEQSTELTRRSNELRQSFQDLREAQQEIVRKEQLAAIGELAAVIAHEIRNPLAIIANAVAGLRRRETAPEDRDTLLAILDEESSRLNRLVGDLLRYARPVNVQPQLISMREVIERTLAGASRRENARVELVEDGPVPSIWGDANLLRQVFDNLVENALQAMAGGGGGLVTITLRRDANNGADGVSVAVQDTGEGMDAQVRSRAKDPFFTTRPSGTGLGLAIVDRIIERHGGELSIVSSAGQGTTITVFLPAAPPDDSVLLFPVIRTSRPPARSPDEPKVRRGSSSR